MGIKSAVYLEDGTITGLYDDQDSPPPKGALNFILNDEQYQHCIRSSKCKIVNGEFVAAPMPTAESLFKNFLRTKMMEVMNIYNRSLNEIPIALNDKPFILSNVPMFATHNHTLGAKATFVTQHSSSWEPSMEVKAGAYVKTSDSHYLVALNDGQTGTSEPTVNAEDMVTQDNNVQWEIYKDFVHLSDQTMLALTVPEMLVTAKQFNECIRKQTKILNIYKTRLARCKDETAVNIIMTEPIMEAFGVRPPENA